jgi:hypothetical protein
MIRYIDRTREYYGALGYPPYRWATHTEIPFAALSKPLSRSTLALVTTAAPFDPASGDQGPGAPYNAAAKFFRVYTTPTDPSPDLRISHLGYDRHHGTASDPESWLPLGALRRAVANGLVGQLATEVIGVPTNRSQRVTRTRDAADALARCGQLGADAALLVPT